jgi:hypothetical protein
MHERDLVPVIAGGDAILCAAQVEPHVEPGQIWATDDFRRELARKPSLWRATPVAGPDGGDRFNVKKEVARSWIYGSGCIASSSDLLQLQAGHPVIKGTRSGACQ